MSGRTVIVGGCGFIGSRLTNSLAWSGTDVTVVDLASPPADLAPLCRVEQRDVTVRESLRGAFDGASTVYLAAALLAKGCDEDPERAWAVSVVGTAHALAEIVASGTRPRVVFLSTGMVYASPAARYPVAEDADTEARDVYTATKLAGERAVASAAASGGFAAAVLRLFTVYGTGPASERRGHFVAGWMDRAADGRPLTIVGNGNQTVDLVHVDDVVRACRLSASAPLAEGECRVFNVGGEAETAVRDIARWMRNVHPPLVVTHTPRTTVLARQSGDIARARSELGYLPAVEPEHGITSLLRERLDGARIAPAAAQSM